MYVWFEGAWVWILEVTQNLVDLIEMGVEL
jgi:hypothetical protein